MIRRLWQQSRRVMSRRQAALHLLGLYFEVVVFNTSTFNSAIFSPGSNPKTSTPLETAEELGAQASQEADTVNSGSMRYWFPQINFSKLRLLDPIRFLIQLFWLIFFRQEREYEAKKVEAEPILHVERRQHARRPSSMSNANGSDTNNNASAGNVPFAANRGPQNSASCSQGTPQGTPQASAHAQTKNRSFFQKILDTRKNVIRNSINLVKRQWVQNIKPYYTRKGTGCYSCFGDVLWLQALIRASARILLTVFAWLLW